MREHVAGGSIQALRKCGRAQDASVLRFVRAEIRYEAKMPSKQLRMIAGAEREKSQ